MKLRRKLTMLIELLKNIFVENGYSEHAVEFEDYESYLFYHREKEEYFIVLDKGIISDDDLRQLSSEGMLNLYRHCKGVEVTDETFEKNTTLIICINNMDIDMVLCNQFEEDAYLFKKNILIYKDENVALLETQLDHDFSLTKLNELLNNGENFDSNKIDIDSDYGLLTKIFIKLPFLSYVRESIVLENLSGIIREQANNENLYNLYIQISSNMLQPDSLDTYQDIIDANLILGANHE